VTVTKIDKSQLKVGMFVEAIEGEWQDNPTLGRRFVIRSGEEIDLICNTEGGSVFINTSLGCAPTGWTTPAAERNLTNATRQEKLEAAAKIQGQAASAKSLVSDICQGRAVTVQSFKPLVDDVARTMEENPSLYIGMSRLRSRDSATYMHSVAVGALLLHFSRSKGMDEETVQHLCMAGMLHDIGKLYIPKHILQKQTVLNPDERKVVEKHTSLGYELLSANKDMPQLVLDICRSHHERLDGNGYPEQLKADAIRTEVRMSTICDVFDALTSTRPYKKGWSSQQALSWMMCRDDQFDRELIWQFVLSLDPEMTKGLF
jgi:putative nucleotidyltransferase with HDIG domain